MSLFGGRPHSPAPASDTEADTPEGSINLPDASINSVPAALPEPPSDASAEYQIDAHVAAGGNPSDDEEYATSEPEARPNKYDGPASNWRRWTAEERGLAASLDQMRAGELNVHLYNAHALKQKLRPLVEDPKSFQPWRSKTRWRRPLGENQWTVPNSWTTWPLEPDVVPRPEETFGRPADDDLERATLRKQDGWKPSGDLEDQLTAVMLETARKRWEARQREGGLDAKISSPVKREASVISRRSRSSSRSRESASNAPNTEPRPTSSQETDGSRVERSITSSQSSSLGSPSSDDGVELADDEEAANIEGSLRLPVIMADEEKAHEILQPTVRSLLTRIDGLLKALHHSRANHL